MTHRGSFRWTERSIAHMGAVMNQTLHTTPTLPALARIIAGAIAVLVLISLAVQSTLGTGTVFENIGGLLRFFTIWGNVAAGLLMAFAAAGRTVAPRVMAALATMLTVIGSIYWLLLSGDHHPVGIDRVTNQVFHTIVPLAAIAWWWRYTPSTPAVLPAVPTIMIPPLAYGAFALALGQLTGFYAYFFVDLPALGAMQFVINNVVLALFFALLGAALLAIKNRFGAKG